MTLCPDKVDVTVSSFVVVFIQMNFFSSELGVAEAQVMKILVRSPILLSYSLESMRRKISYFEEGLQLGANDVRMESLAHLPGDSARLIIEIWVYEYQQDTGWKFVIQLVLKLRSFVLLPTNLCRFLTFLCRYPASYLAAHKFWGIALMGSSPS